MCSFLNLTSKVSKWVSWVRAEFSIQGDVNLVGFDGLMLVQMERQEFLNHWPPFIGDIGWEHFQFVLNRSTQESQVMIDTFTSFCLFFNFKLERGEY